jgi:glutamate racemase
MQQQPIGIFDSGIGGLSVLKQFVRFLPQESYIYLGDTARVPYGNRSVEIVRQYAVECTDFLLKKGVKLIVAACNTVSAVALDAVIERAGDIPVVGMIAPAAGAALRETSNGQIGVIGTRATITSKAYTNSICKLAMDSSLIEVHSQPCPLFVPFVEEGMFKTEAARLVAQEYLAPLIKKNVDTLVLGCTHYPLLQSLIMEIMPGVRLIDSGEHASVFSLRLLAERKQLVAERSEFISKPHIDFYITDLPALFFENADSFLGFEINKPNIVKSL